MGMTQVLAVLGVVLVGYLAFVATLGLNQANLLYLPDRPVTAMPADVGLDYESLMLTTADGIRIHGWYVPAAEARAVVLFFHGNAGNIGHRLETLRFLHELGLATLIVDYRGYGRSTGRPSEAGTYRDAEAAWRYLTAERGIAPERIVVFGRSLGGAVAAYLAAQKTPAGLVVESAFTSLPAIAAELYPYLPARWISRYRYPTADYVAEVQAPVLVIHGRDDGLTPVDHGRAILDRASEPKRMRIVTGGHNAGFLSDEGAYRDAWQHFLAEHLDRKGRGRSSEPVE